jgi:hypothetical protein
MWRDCILSRRAKEWAGLGRALDALAAGVILLQGCSSPRADSTVAMLPLQFARAETNPPAGPAGPTIRFDQGIGRPVDNRIGDFMYFVPLISPDPVTIDQSAGNAQRTHVHPTARHLATDTFLVSADFELIGEGTHRNNFDPADNIRRHERKLKEGGSLDRVLTYISVEGAGRGLIEVEGTVSNRVATVTEVRLQFNAHGQTSPVSIGLNDIHFVNGAVKFDNALVARVNSLKFQRSPGRPAKMAVTVASVKRADASDNLWQKLKGSVAGTLANLVLKPITVDEVGNEAMLDFGRALAAGEPSFTFPHARHLKSEAAAQP